MAEKERSRVTFPESRRDGKFVQLYVCGEPYFRHGSMFSKYFHILKLALNEFQLGFEEIDIHGNEVPALKGENYEVVGMGIVSNLDSGLKLFDKSLDYRLGPDQKHLDDLKPYLPEGLTIKISEGF